MINALLKLTEPLYQLERKRQKLLQAGAVSARLLPLLSAPISAGNTRLSTGRILSVDLETTGLNPDKDTILSIGMVTIEAEKILLKSACHRYIAWPDAVKAETAVINHITPEQLKTGGALADALELFLQQAQGKWLLAHGSGIERAFLAKALGMKDLPLIWLDTLNIEKSLIEHKRRSVNNYSLAYLRTVYELPDYDAHHALSDAVATAELFLAQAKVLFRHESAYLNPLYRRSVRAAP